MMRPSTFEGEFETFDKSKSGSGLTHLLYRMSIGASLLFLNAILALGLSAYFAYRNAKLAKRHSPASNRVRSESLTGSGRTWLWKRSNEAGVDTEDELDVGGLEEPVDARADSAQFRYVT